MTTDDMNTHDLLSDDGLAMLLLCSSFGTAQPAPPDVSAPFTLSEWNQLARKIQASSLKRPAALAGQDAANLARELQLAPDEAERVARLLARSGRVALELDGLFSRGMWVAARVDPHYPARLRNTLKHQAPTVIFGAGERVLLTGHTVAVVGSRNIDPAGAAFAQEFARHAVAEGFAIVSGGARGTDLVAMNAALDAGGESVGVLADSLERTIRAPEMRQLLLDRRVTLVTPYAPTAGFSVGAAMGRNKVIYGLAELALVVSSEHEKGGTWAGAVEALKAAWCPVLVRATDDALKGNRELLKKGALSLAEPRVPAAEALAAARLAAAPASPVEQELFALHETKPPGEPG
jgi:predicted Rossmann fold nucleotide-binding protein DprA/Smf involved in DNA uptake